MWYLVVAIICFWLGWFFREPKNREKVKGFIKQQIENRRESQKKQKGRSRRVQPRERIL